MMSWKGQGQRQEEAKWREGAIEFAQRDFVVVGLQRGFEWRGWWIRRGSLVVVVEVDVDVEGRRGEGSWRRFGRDRSLSPSLYLGSCRVDGREERRGLVGRVEGRRRQRGLGIRLELVDVLLDDVLLDDVLLVDVLLDAMKREEGMRC